jgi:D-glycero-alpha-D-manno-heptose-7-phosphate kinase
MMFYTGISRFASDIAKDQISAIPKKSNELKTISEMTDEAYSILNSENNLNDFGKLLNESWQIKKSLSKKISNEVIDTIYKKAINAGALGGKLLGRWWWLYNILCTSRIPSYC